MDKSDLSLVFSDRARRGRSYFEAIIRAGSLTIGIAVTSRGILFGVVRRR